MDGPSNCKLPADVIWEILLRLPVKTLLRFKCVCKHWYILIANPSFINQHFGHKSNQERLLVRYGIRNQEGYAYALYGDDHMSFGYEEPDHLQMPDTVTDLLGPVNGIFCVVSKSGRVALLNPAMRQFKPLPSHHRNVQPPLTIYDEVAIFGLDPSSGDYKLVSFRYFSNKRTNVTNRIYLPLASVYSLSTDSWRHLEDVDLVNSMCCSYNSLGKTWLNGIYYLLVLLNDADLAILAFDMSSEKFQKIQVPDCIKYQERSVGLALCGDSIALLSYDDVDTIDKCVDIWVMRKEGPWTKSFTIGPFQDIMRPLCFWKNNEVLFEGAASVLALNVSNQKLRIIATREEEGGFMCNWVFSYKESLVSIKREEDNCMLWNTSSDLVKKFFGYSSTNG